MTSTTTTAPAPVPVPVPLPGAMYSPRAFETVADALGAMDHVEALAILFEELAMSGFSIPELVAEAAAMSTERLPRGMSLTDARPGCWESSCFEPMIPESAVLAGPGAAPLDVDCDTCGAQRDGSCRHLTTYADLKHPHPERVKAAAAATYYSPEMGWS